MNWMQENCISVELHDERRSGRSICASFNGELRDEQTAAFEALSAHDTGVLSATTAFGKTVIGAAMIAEKKGQHADPCTPCAADGTMEGAAGAVSCDW